MLLVAALLFCGADLAEFEKAMANYLGVRYALGVGNATDGLLFAFRAAGLQAGDEVIFLPYDGCRAGGGHYAGGIPVPVDIGPDRLLDPGSITAAVTARTKFIVPTST